MTPRVPGFGSVTSDAAATEALRLVEAGVPIAALRLPIPDPRFSRSLVLRRPDQVEPSEMTTFAWKVSLVDALGAGAAMAAGPKDRPETIVAAASAVAPIAFGMRVRDM
ncbi:hypothetical protein BIU96_03610 [Curtobacterium sp. MCBA15_008]|nr:hypothetical protein BIU96_03610 [Curtobacterium sp. MCBA15_008]